MLKTVRTADARRPGRLLQIKVFPTPSLHLCGPMDQAPREQSDRDTHKWARKCGEGVTPWIQDGPSVGAAKGEQAQESLLTFGAINVYQAPTVCSTLLSNGGESCEQKNCCPALSAQSSPSHRETRWERKNCTTQVTTQGCSQDDIVPRRHGGV